MVQSLEGTGLIINDLQPDGTWQTTGANPTDSCIGYRSDVSCGTWSESKMIELNNGVGSSRVSRLGNAKTAESRKKGAEGNDYGV
jgi:hypothetical protein